MKILVVLICSLMSRVQGSLEPAGYKPIGTYPQTEYLPPSSGNYRMENWYTSPSLDLSIQDIPEVPKELSRSLSLPSPREPVPFSHYLPANPQTFDRNDHESVIEQKEKNPTIVIEPTFTLPRKSYVPSNGEQSLSELHALDRSYSRSDERSNHVSSSLFGRNEFTPEEANSIYRPSASDKSSSDDSWGYGQRRGNSVSSDYQYLSTENQTPAKYNFEYEVKDNYGNDYGHKEVRDGERTQGIYKVLLSDGRRQIVHYEADSHGYRPVITYEDADSSTARGSAVNKK